MKPMVRIDNQPGQVIFSGRTPVGLDQVDVKVPDSIQPGGSVPVQLNIGGVDSNLVMISVQ